MKESIKLMLTIAAAIIVATLIDKFVISKIGNYDEFGDYDGEEFQ